MSIAREPDLYGNLTLGASCTGCAGVQNAPSPDDEAYGSGPDLTGPVEIGFIYNSNNTENGPFGYGRTLDTKFTLKVTGDQAVIQRGNSTRSLFKRGTRLTPPPSNPNGPQFISLGGYHYDPQKVGSRNKLTRFDNNSWVETMPDGLEMAYNNVSDGQTAALSYAEDSVGNRHTFFYSTDAKKLLIGIEDAYGRRTTLTYNAAQTLLISVTDFAGRITNFEYDTTSITGKSLLTKITGPTGCQTRYEYNAQALLTAVVDPNGFRTEYTYDSKKRVLTRNVVGVGINRYDYSVNGAVQTDMLGQTTTFQLDDKENIISVTNALGQTRAVSRDANGWETARPDMTGKIEYYEYNERGDVVLSYDQFGRRTVTMRDQCGNPTSITYPDGSVERMDWGSYDLTARRRRLLKHTDELGFETTYTYNQRGQVASITDALGAATSMEYDSFGRLVRSTNALSQITTFEYDAADNLAARVDALGNRWTYEYDLADRLIKSTDAEGGVMEFGYDANGNLNLQKDELQYVTTTKYNAFDLPYEQTDALNGVTRWEYDKMGQQIATVDALGQRSTVEINALGQISATVDALGRRTINEFDSNNRLAVTRNAQGEAITRNYDRANQFTRLVDALGRITRFVYDVRGRLVTTTQVVPGGDNVVTSVEYDLKGQPIAEVDALGNRTVTEYDGVGRPIAITDTNGNRTQMEYDDIGQQTAQVNALGERTTMQYDAAGRHIVTRDALNQGTRMIYDKVGRLRYVRDANNMIRRLEYDAKGQQTVEVDGLGFRTSVEYDALGRQTAIIDGKGNRTEMEYDAIGQLLLRRDALNGVESFTYDKAGNQLTRTDSRNQLTNYSYDKADRLIKEQLTGGVATTFTYDVMGQQLRMTDSSGTTTNTYDALGRVLSETNGRGNKLSYEYDAAGRRTAMVDPENGRTLYSYDNNGWLTKLTNPQNGVTVYAYDKLGRELTKTLPNGVKSSHVYNQVGDETLQEERDARGTLLSRYASTYNNVGMKQSVTELNGSVTTYVYDANYALTSEERVGTSPYKLAYIYDAAGNRQFSEVEGVRTRDYLNAANQITKRVGPNGTVNFTYDADGNLSSETAADGSGKSYFFDGRDQLIAVEMKSAGGALVHRSEFSYDGLGRLMKSVEFTRSGTAWLKQSETNRVFDGLDTVQERGESNQVLAQLTRDGNIGGVLSRKVGANTAFFSYDGNGNVTLLRDAQANSVGRYRYDGFGNALEVTGSVALENVHRFSTKELHAPSGLYYYGFRFYSPALGRWINRDPIGEAGGVNLYQMVGNNLINFVDAYGLARVELRWRYVASADDAPGIKDAVEWIDKDNGDFGKSTSLSSMVRQASGNHAFILVWETDSKGNKIGVPKYFGGYKGSGLNWGTKLTARYGDYLPPEGFKGCPDYYYQPGHRDFRGSILIADDDLPATAYINRFKKVADKINKLNLRYDWTGTNSNSVARTYLQVGLGLDVTSQLGRGRGGLLGWKYILLPKVRNTTVEEALSNPNMQNPLPGP